jgi:hypothetical protein
MGVVAEGLTSNIGLGAEGVVTLHVGLEMNPRRVPLTATPR